MKALPVNGLSTTEAGKKPPPAVPSGDAVAFAVTMESATDAELASTGLMDEGARVDEPLDPTDAMWADHPVMFVPVDAPPTPVNTLFPVFGHAVEGEGTSAMSAPRAETKTPPASLPPTSEPAAAARPVAIEPALGAPVKNDAGPVGGSSVPTAQVLSVQALSEPDAPLDLGEIELGTMSATDSAEGGVAMNGASSGDAGGSPSWTPPSTPSSTVSVKPADTSAAAFSLDELLAEPVLPPPPTLNDGVVRVQLDPKLVVEVALSGNEVDVRVEGGDELNSELRDLEGELSNALADGGYDLRRYRFRQTYDRGPAATQNAGSAESPEPTRVMRGATIDAVA